ncbi:hypothetical protein ACFO4O_12075 [Glaciecola siphonariae]|uniref:Uncharacterized protein n=1 Tax=Glaciecola siphonariae TaxID=521012 RepID=A0ABV9LWI3_9ALTE
MKKTCVQVLLVVGGLLPLNLQAQSIEDARKCTTIENDSVRLACFDNFFHSDSLSSAKTKAASGLAPANQTPEMTVAPPTFNETAQASAPSPVSLPLQTTAPSQTSTPQIPATSNTPLAAPDVSKQVAQAPSSKADLIDQFGAEDLQREAPQQARLDRIDSVIDDISENNRGIRTFTLANGHKWRETESSRLRLKKGMAIYVEKGALSAYFLGKESSNRRVRVKRVQ